MKAKVWVPLIIIIAAIGWLAATNVSAANYFYVVDELPELSDPVFQNTIKVKGRIVPGSIDKTKVRPVTFTMQEHGKELKVAYVSDQPLPDMFKDHAETVVEGRMLADGSFEASHLQAKCASKYEAAGPQAESAEYDTSEPELVN